MPAVSDETMGPWMEYVYMQKPRPTNATGVEVTLSVLDPNGNTYEIGKATSDAYGSYSLVWNPPVPGRYLILAKFAGTESFWPSYAETALNVEEAPVASPTDKEPLITLPPREMYVIGTGIAIIIAIALATLIIVRKRPKKIPFLFSIMQTKKFFNPKKILNT